MSDDELADKFRECAAWGRLPKASAEKVIELVFDLEKLKNIRELTRLLQTGAKAAPAPTKRARHARKGRRKQEVTTAATMHG